MTFGAGDAPEVGGAAVGIIVVYGMMTLLMTIDGAEIETRKKMNQMTNVALAQALMGAEAVRAGMSEATLARRLTQRSKCQLLHHLGRLRRQQTILIKLGRVWMLLSTVEETDGSEESSRHGKQKEAEEADSDEIQPEAEGRSQTTSTEDAQQIEGNRRKKEISTMGRSMVTTSMTLSGTADVGQQGWL